MELKMPKGKLNLGSQSKSKENWEDLNVNLTTIWMNWVLLSEIWEEIIKDNKN